MGLFGHVSIGSLSLVDLKDKGNGTGADAGSYSF